MSDSVDEGFLEWLLEDQEKKGVDIDGHYTTITSNPEAPHLTRAYTLRQLTEAMKEGEYWPLQVYNLFYYGPTGMKEAYEQSKKQKKN
ncbi:MAG: hypothetical protein Q8R37_05310 [Nanoarchaeota archaeon]|nr:hypothetical protein [Nanoarchaeota archaeon]